MICEGKSKDDVKTGIIGEGQLVLAMITAFLPNLWHTTFTRSGWFLRDHEAERQSTNKSILSQYITKELVLPTCVTLFHSSERPPIFTKPPVNAL